MHPPDGALAAIERNPALYNFKGDPVLLKLIPAKAASKKPTVVFMTIGFDDVCARDFCFKKRQGIRSLDYPEAFAEGSRQPDFRYLRRDPSLRSDSFCRACPTKTTYPYHQYIKLI